MPSSDNRNRSTDPRSSSPFEQSLLDDLSVVIVGNKVLPVSPTADCEAAPPTASARGQSVMHHHEARSGAVRDDGDAGRGKDRA